MFNKVRLLQIIGMAFVISFTANSVVHARTYIVNGLVSAVPFIGYGMNNLGKRIPGSKVFSYITSVEGNGVIKPNIISDIEARYKQNPSEPINLIGISYGAGMITDIANTLARKNIPVNYMATIEGGKMKTIKANVRQIDNFICTGADCSRSRVNLAGGNTTTTLNQFSYKDGHINLGNNPKVHSRITSLVR
ncbi:MAG: hypothetical protein AAF217_12715 [Pseudomonadota bacterium]